jgi:hypothetical protein
MQGVYQFDGGFPVDVEDGSPKALAYVGMGLCLFSFWSSVALLVF